MSRRYFRLSTLGRLGLSSVAVDTERTENVRPRHLAVLTVLALSPRGMKRDLLVGMFWGGETEERARHSLSNALSNLRGILGPAGVTGRRDDVQLSEDVPIEIDALQFAAACDARDDVRAASLYAGPFLDGVYVADSSGFDHWVARERSRLQHQFLQVCERRVPTLLRSAQWTEAADLARRWLDAAPDSAPAFVAFLSARAAPDTPAALGSAIAEYERLRQFLRESHGLRPGASVTTLVTELRERLELADARAASAVSVEQVIAPKPDIEVRQPPTVTVSLESRSASTRQPRGRSWLGLAGVGTLGFALAIFWLARPRAAATSEAARPVVAVTSFDDVRGDSSIAWLRAGLPRLIAADLDATGGLEVVPPSRVRDVIVRLAGSSLARLTDDQSVDVGRRLGAGSVVSGGISTANGGYLLDVTARSTTDSRQAQSYTVFASNPVELAQLAAARLANMLSIGRGSVRPSDGSAAQYSEIETTNPDAYRHFVRGSLAMDAEQFSNAARELDAAIAIDSGFAEAIRARRNAAQLLGDTPAERRLAILAARYERRLPEIDRLFDEMLSADTLGESVRANAVSIRIVERFPRDPRAYSIRADFLAGRGRWLAAESVLVRELALDSLAMSAGSGPCTPCQVLWRLSRTRLASANRSGAEAAARQWVSLQPDLPAAWHNLSATLAALGRSAETVEAGYHEMALTKESTAIVDFGRTMLAAGRYDIVDSLLHEWDGPKGRADAVLADGAVDLRAMLQRERGQFRASIETLDTVSTQNGMGLVRADALARTGRLTDARKILELFGHPAGSHLGALTGPEARGFSWAHALEADALMRAGDTLTARAFIDSLAQSGAQSYFSRDLTLHHHVRGMLYYAERRYADAERELRLGEWAANTWTRTNVELARAQLAQGGAHAADAVSSLRDALLAPLDGMGRYVPKTEIDWWLARAFAAAGQRDSARVYRAYVTNAWQDADPAVRALLDSLPLR